MLINTHKKHPILAALEQSPIEFYLGGSRRMSDRSSGEDAFVVTPETDWDFSCTFSKEAVQWLTDLNFEHSTTSAYDLDTEATCIMKYKDSGISVDVVLRKDVKFYARVFEAIPVSFYLTHLWKSSPDLRVPRDTIGDTMNALFAVGRACKE